MILLYNECKGFNHSRKLCMYLKSKVPKDQQVPLHVAKSNSTNLLDFTAKNFEYQNSSFHEFIDKITIKKNSNNSNTSVSNSGSATDNEIESPNSSGATNSTNNLISGTESNNENVNVCHCHVS